MYGPGLAIVKQFSRHDMRAALVYTSTMPRPGLFVLLAVTALAGCDRPEGGGAPCGIAALAGPVTLLDQFSVPNRTLATAPEGMPPRLVVRFAAGPAMTGLVGHTDSTLVVGVEGPVPATPQVGFGVLIVGSDDRPHGVLLYEGQPIEGAPELGSVQVADTTVPLLGLTADPGRYETPGCPLFPDSLIQ